MISNRIKNLPSSATIAMTQLSRELKAQGLDIISLSIGEPDFNTPDFIKEAGIQAIKDNYSYYMPVSGYLDLREAICEKLKRDNQLTYQPEHIVVSTGAKNAIINTMYALINPGDEVLIPAPYWVSYPAMVQLAEGKPVFINAYIDNDFKITPEQLEAAITDKTKLLIYSSPCNPSGTVYSKEELAAFASVLERHPQVYIISDEIYEHISFGVPYASLAQFDAIKDRVIVVNGVAKGFAMTGWRIGYIAANKEIAAACDKFQGQVTSGTCSIAQRATIPAMLQNPKESVDMQRMIQAFKERKELLVSLLKDIPLLKVNNPQGAFYVFPNVSAYYGKTDGDKVITNCSDFCLYILHKAHVALVPGDAFGNANCIRISYATSKENIIKAIDRVKQALAELK